MRPTPEEERLLCSGPLALDVVLLPPPEIRQLCIEYSSRLNGRLLLGEKDRVPHCSLFMLCAASEAAVAIRALLTSFVVRMGRVECFIECIQAFRRKGCDPLVHLLIVKSPSILELQLEIARLLEPYVLDLCPDSAFVLDAGEALSESSHSWVLNFGECSSGDRYEPHITLGYGEPGGEYAFPGSFQAELALYRLGNHCSCRRRLLL